jgi:hypothetical protein
MAALLPESTDHSLKIVQVLSRTERFGWCLRTTTGFTNAPIAAMLGPAGELLQANAAEISRKSRAGDSATPAGSGLPA